MKLSASQRLPALVADHVSERAKRVLDKIELFVHEKCNPADAIFNQQLGQSTQERFSAHPPILEDLKREARRMGLWNLFLAQGHYSQGAGFSNLEYGLMAEQLGESQIASEVSEPTTVASRRRTLMDEWHSTGHELLSSGHRQYGGVGKIWECRAKRGMAQALARRQDPISFLDDGAGHCFQRCD